MAHGSVDPGSRESAGHWGPRCGDVPSTHSAEVRQLLHGAYGETDFLIGRVRSFTNSHNARARRPHFRIGSDPAKLRKKAHALGTG